MYCGQGGRILREDDVWKEAILGMIVLLWMDCGLNRMLVAGRVGASRLVAKIGARLVVVSRKLCRSIVPLASDAMAISNTADLVDVA